MHRIGQKNRVSIKIGTLPNFTAVLMPRICRKFTEQHPEIALQLIEYPLETYFKNFINGNFEITTEYMSGYLFEQPDYMFIKLTVDTHRCGMSPDHPLTGKEKITLADLEGQRIMMYAPGITRADDRLRSYIERNTSSVEIINIYHYSSSLPLRCELEGLILIYYAMYWESFPTLVTSPMEIALNFPIDIGLGYKADASYAVGLFIELAKKLYSPSGC